MTTDNESFLKVRCKILLVAAILMLQRGVRFSEEITQHKPLDYVFYHASGHVSGQKIVTTEYRAFIESDCLGEVPGSDCGEGVLVGADALPDLLSSFFDSSWF